jgi:uncharacterized membrane protein YfcA
MFKSKIFTGWYFTALATWAVLFALFNSIKFFLDHWYYAVMMIGGAFVAGFTPEGGGAVAFPVLSVFLKVDRVLARDFAMMIQSIGMTSASIFILTHARTRVKDYRPLLGFVPLAAIGAGFGFMFLQKIPVYIIQAMFLSLSATFVITYYLSDHRGTKETVDIGSSLDLFYLGLVLVIGGMISSLFGTGADVVLYLLLITHFNMTAKKATRISIVLQASISLFGFAYRAFVDHGLTSYQIKTWLCAFPVVLFMAPFGVYVLARLHVNWMLRVIIVLNIFQLLYFNLKEPSAPKTVASVVFCGILAIIFYFMLRQVAAKHREANAKHLAETALQGPVRV